MAFKAPFDRILDWSAWGALREQVVLTLREDKGVHANQYVAKAFSWLSNATRLNARP